MRGTIDKYDASTRILSLSTSNGTVQFPLASTARIRQGWHKLDPLELRKLVGYRAAIGYSESGGNKTVESVHVFGKEREDREMSSRVLVLVVDDDPQVAKLVTNLLASRGYDVRTASDAESAMSSVRAWRPALVICNLEMPTVDGIELCRRVRQTSNVAIIVVSGNSDVRSEVAALNAGADDYIVEAVQHRESAGPRARRAATECRDAGGIAARCR